MNARRPILARSLVNQVVDWFIESITAGRLRAGERLQEAPLARELGVSRSVLREALQRLEGLKLVSRTENIGASIARPSRREVDELYCARTALECAATRLAAEVMPEDEILRLQLSLTREQARRPAGSATPARYQFHTRVVEASGNARLADMLCGELYHNLRLSRHCYAARPGRQADVVPEHLAILQAISDRDPDRAEALARQHLRNAHAALVWTEDEPVGQDVAASAVILAPAELPMLRQA